MSGSQTIGAGGKSASLQGKDFITIGIFGLLLFVSFFVFAMVLGMNANAFWFTHACGSIPGGIVWMYVAGKVNKRGAIAAMGAITAVVGLLLGMFWAGPVGIVIGAVIAEFICGVGERRTTLRCCVGFAAFTLCFWAGQMSMLFFAGSSYVDMVVASGMSREYGEALVAFMQSPLILVSLAATAVVPLFGGWIGSKMFKKHFARIAA